MQLELQRLLSRGIGGLPRHVVIDVGGIIRRCREVEPGYDPLRELLTAARRSRRSDTWIVAPVAYGMALTSAELDAIAQKLRAGGVTSIIRSTEPVAALLAGAGLATKPALVTAGAEERPYELWSVGSSVAVVLDAETGMLWTSAMVEGRFGPPAVLPELCAIVGAEPGERGLGGKAAPRYRDGIVDALTGRVAWSEAKVHPAVRELVTARQADVAATALRLRGGDRPDEKARTVVATRLAPATDNTAHVLASVRVAGDGYVLGSVDVIVGDEVAHAVDAAACSALLAKIAASHPKRWFAPRALDLLAAMTDGGLPLPKAVVDPGLAAFALEPGKPRRLSQAVPDVDLPPHLETWMQDVRRERLPPKDLSRFVDALPDLDAALTTALRRAGLFDLVENDIAPTLPVLAKMERMGAWVGPPAGHADWKALEQHVGELLTKCEADASLIASDGVDIYRASTAAIVRACKKLGWGIPTSRWAPDLTSQQQFARIVEVGFPAARAVKEARSLTSKSGVHFWLQHLLREPTRLRGKSLPTVSGRWALSDLPLHGFPKKSKIAKTMRGGLVAPPGHVLVGADQNGFELRLLAYLSADPGLLDLAKEDDIHGALAQHLYGTVTPETRKRAKLATYALVYGQTEDGFRRARHDLTNDDAVDLYGKITGDVRGGPCPPGSRPCRVRGEGGTAHSGGMAHPRAATQVAKEAARSRFNATVQGLGADILRWVLRVLDAGLVPYGAHIVHQAHDEVLIAVPDTGDVLAVSKLLVDTMTAGVMHRSGLLTHPVRLVANPHTGKTWRDLI